MSDHNSTIENFIQIHSSPEYDMTTEEGVIEQYVHLLRILVESRERGHPCPDFPKGYRFCSLSQNLPPDTATKVYRAYGIRFKGITQEQLQTAFDMLIHPLRRGEASFFLVSCDEFGPVSYVLSGELMYRTQPFFILYATGECPTLGFGFLPYEMAKAANEQSFMSADLTQPVIPDGLYMVTIDTPVSIDHLFSFCEQQAQEPIQ